MKKLLLGIVLGTCLGLVSSCESDFKKCMDTNFAKLVPELPKIPKDIYDMHRDRQNFHDAKIGETEEGKASHAAWELLQKHCFGPNENAPLPDEGTDCEALNEDWFRKYKVTEPMFVKFEQTHIQKLKEKAKTFAADICNAQGIYK